uniref:Glypican-3 n=1 Tax=Poecilia latipinna TaxID=48699 RepID=A0A3B3THM3_9TELE
AGSTASVYRIERSHLMRFGCLSHWEKPEPTRVALQLLPSAHPVSAGSLPGGDLQVCQTKGPTCCSKKMEERYQVAARSNMESGLQVVSAHLKRLIIQNAAIFQEAFDLVLRHGRNSTLTVLKSEFPALVPGAQSSVGQLFLDMSLYILGSDSTVDHMVAAFFGKLFPLTYRRLLGGGASAASEECVRGAWKDSGAFGPYPKLIMTRLSRSLLATRVFLQALNLGIEVVNTTDHLRPSRDCGRALLRLWYCPHCQGMLSPPACRGFCQTAMQGCLGGAAEVQPHWRSYIDGLGKLAGGMRGEQDMEAVVLRLPSLIKLALKQAVNARSRGMCGHATKRASRSVEAPPLHHFILCLSPFHLREFITNLKSFSSFYSGLGEALCSREPTAANNSLCWNGQEMTDRYGLIMAFISERICWKIHGQILDLAAGPNGVIAGWQERRQNDGEITMSCSKQFSRVTCEGIPSANIAGIRFQSIPDRRSLSPPSQDLLQKPGPAVLSHIVKFRRSGEEGKG